tara:strand:- start:144 stop:521 length:378 start_codon:yes stop_codon:yes gene_type:complete
MRTIGAKTNKECWTLKIYYKKDTRFNDTHYDKIIANGTFKTLNDISNFLGITYNQVSELTSKSGRNKTKNKYSFYPIIEITKIDCPNITNPIDKLEPPIIDNNYEEHTDEFLQEQNPHLDIVSVS